MTGIPKGTERDRALRMLARFVAGDGIELGPGHQPFPLPYAGATARYVDRWKPDENTELFPELGDDAVFALPDIIADLNVDRLSMIADQSEDFVIASHVLEHLTDPLAQLSEIHRVLRPGGVALVLLPERTLTFDRARQGTTLPHLIADNDVGMTVADDAHIEEFLIYAEGWHESWDDAAGRKARFDMQRDRSFHVHCWTQEEFIPVLRHTITAMGMSWELIDAYFVADVVDSIEFGFVVRRSLHAGDAEVLAKRLDKTWAALVDSRKERPRPKPRKPHPRRDALNRNPAYRAVRRRARPLRQAAVTMVGKVRARASTKPESESHD